MCPCPGYYGWKVQPVCANDIVYVQRWVLSVCMRSLRDTREYNDSCN